MGWTTMAMPREGARAYLDTLYSWSDDQRRHKVIDSSLVGGREYYTAVETTTIASGERTVFAGVALVSISRRHGEEFGHKDMSEDMGPFYYNCPLRILDRLTETNNEQALTWRAKCREAAALRSASNKGPKLAAGQRVRFAEPIKFSNGAVLSEFEIEQPLFSKGLVFIDPETRNRYRISGARTRQRSVIAPVQQGQ